MALVDLLIDSRARLVVAHRGDSAHHPENTLPSFDRAAALGADALEFDLRLTADGAVVVHHDPTLDRTSSRRGEVRAMTLAQLRAADAGAGFVSADGSRPFAGQGIVVPTFDEMLDRYRGLPLLIEVKVPEVVPEARRLIERHAARDRVLLDSTDDAAVVPFRDRYRTGASMREVVRLLPHAWLAGPRRLAYEALCIPPWYHGIPVPVERLARAVRGAGGATHVWTVNDPAQAERLWRAGINGIITDDPAAMLAVRAGLQGAAHSG